MFCRTLLLLPVTLQCIFYWNGVNPRRLGLIGRQPWKNTVENSVKSPVGLDSPTVRAYQKNYRGDVIHVITKIGNSQVTLPHLRFEDYNFEGLSIELECNATYPVKWIYNGSGAPPVHMQTHRHVKDFFDLKTYIYQATVLFTHTTMDQTGTYTCLPMDKSGPKFQTFLEVFVPGNRNFVADSKKSLTIVADENEQWLTLPCAVDLNTTVTLLKKLLSNEPAVLKTTDSNKYEVLSPGKDLTFNPAEGFRIRWSVFQNPWTNYKCIGRKGENFEILNIIVNPPVRKGKPAVLEFISDGANNRLLCCSSTKVPLLIKSTGCTSVPDCSLRRKYLEAKKISLRSENKVMYDNGRTCVAYEMSDDHDESGMLQCSAGETLEYYYFSKEQGILITNFTQLPPLEQILNLHIEPSPTPGKVFVTCYPNSFFFSHGIKWAWKRPNGIVQIIQHERLPAPTFIEVDRMDNLDSKIYCFAPVLTSSTDWKAKSIMIK